MSSATLICRQRSYNSSRDIATFATDAPGAAHLSSTDAYNCALCRRHKATLCSAILSTYFR